MKIFALLPFIFASSHAPLIQVNSYAEITVSIDLVIVKGEGSGGTENFIHVLDAGSLHPHLKGAVEITYDLDYSGHTTYGPLVIKNFAVNNDTNEAIYTNFAYNQPKVYSNDKFVVALPQSSLAPYFNEDPYRMGFSHHFGDMGTPISLDVADLYLDPGYKVWPQNSSLDLLRNSSTFSIQPWVDETIIYYAEAFNVAPSNFVLVLPIIISFEVYCTDNCVFSVPETPDCGEVIDLPGIIFDIIGAPYFFLTMGFDVVLFPGTPYAFNLGIILMALVSVSIVVFIIRRFLK